jgi:hypothetical protein
MRLGSNKCTGLARSRSSASSTMCTPVRRASTAGWYSAVSTHRMPHPMIRSTCPTNPTRRSSYPTIPDWSNPSRSSQSSSTRNHRTRPSRVPGGKLRRRGVGGVGRISMHQLDSFRRRLVCCRQTPIVDSADRKTIARKSQGRALSTKSRPVLLGGTKTLRRDEGGPG